MTKRKAAKKKRALDIIRIYNEVCLYKYEDPDDTPEERAVRERYGQAVARLRAQGGHPEPISEL